MLIFLQRILNAEYSSASTHIVYLKIYFVMGLTIVVIIVMKQAMPIVTVRDALSLLLFN